MSRSLLSLNLKTLVTVVGQQMLKNDLVVGSGILLGSVGGSLFLIMACPCRTLQDTVKSNKTDPFPYPSCIP